MTHFVVHTSDGLYWTGNNTVGDIAAAEVFTSREHAKLIAMRVSPAEVLTFNLADVDLAYPQPAGRTKSTRGSAGCVATPSTKP